MADQREASETPAERLKAARILLRLTGTAFAMLVDVPASTYYGHENGSRGLGRDVAKLYAPSLGVSPEWLLLGVGAGPVDRTLTDHLFTGMADRGHHFEGFTAERAVFHLIDKLSARVIELEQRDHRPDGRRLEVVR